MKVSSLSHNVLFRQFLDSKMRNNDKTQEEVIRKKKTEKKKKNGREKNVRNT